jgi:hypothetical protein
MITEEAFNELARENVLLRDLYLEVESWNSIILCEGCIPDWLKGQWYNCITNRIEEIKKDFGPIA